MAESEQHPASEFRCGAAARWLPRALGGSVLAATLLGTLGAAVSRGTVGRRAAQFLTVVGAAAAWIVVRSGAETRHAFRLTDDALVVVSGRRESRVELGSLARLDFEPAFTRRGRWIPAAVLVDGAGTAWRVPALLESGDRFVRELLTRARRNDLDAWAAERDLSRRMAQARGRVVLGYAIAAGLLVASVAHVVGR